MVVEVEVAEAEDIYGDGHQHSYGRGRTAAKRLPNEDEEEEKKKSSIGKRRE